MAFWRAKYELCPFGEAAEWARHAQAQSNFCNAYRDRKKKPHPYEPENFIPHSLG